ncbi:hypothetical protein [Rhodococcus opacus]|uniref:hypothetical protein n=2 Tax=Nocardiaceae TaxID=85025 RepID=UPI001E61ACDE|nr:hypothetical protein [Rhodococcus opacus]
MSTLLICPAVYRHSTRRPIAHHSAPDHKLGACEDAFMRTENHDESAGGSRPTADDGSFTLTVDGEVFTVTLRPEEPGACDCDWESGPNAPSAPLQPNTIDEHRESIRDFLSQINPETGYIGD